MVETILFPHENHPYRLEFGDDKKNITVCWFQCEEHLEKYITRYNLNKKKIKIDYRDEQPTQSSKTNKKKLQSTTQKNSNRSGGGNRGSTKNLDTPGTSHRSGKSK